MMGGPDMCVSVCVCVFSVGLKQWELEKS